jgi:hypothetical protein
MYKINYHNFCLTWKFAEENLLENNYWMETDYSPYKHVATG